MDVSLSDLLVCPRCGPGYGLVLLPTESSDRRVRAGVLGCANCRERYPIADGVADLRAGVPFEGGIEGGVGEAPGMEAVAGGDDAHVRLAGLMGLAGAGGTVLVAGPAADFAPALAALVEELVVVTVAEETATGESAAAGPVSRVRASRMLPFRTGSLRGVALTGGRAALVEEGARVLGREGRLVLDPAPPGAADRLASAGLRVVATEGRVAVAARRS